ncbi:hypothetical protein G6F31_017354 [Rhizopus arrhizus]|nr:hypothetical protein G6F31_017354 [Rhizopus arrhizus]
MGAARIRRGNARSGPCFVPDIGGRAFPASIARISQSAGHRTGAVESRRGALRHVPEPGQAARGVLGGAGLGAAHGGRQRTQHGGGCLAGGGRGDRGVSGGCPGAGRGGLGAQMAGQRLDLVDQQRAAGHASRRSLVPRLCTAAAGDALAPPSLGRLGRRGGCCRAFRTGALRRRLAMGFAGGPGRRGLWRRVPLWRTGGSGAGAPGPERRALRIVYLSDARGAIGPAAALLYGSAG